MIAKIKAKLKPIIKLLPLCQNHDQPQIALIRLEGVIGKAGLGSGLKAADLGYFSKIEKSKNLKALAVQINSPGGSPVQSELIFEKLRQLAKKTQLPLYVFCEDVAASGGYFLALAGDHIYALPSSIIGSIGVISSGFGFTQAIARLGIERRVITSGKNKAIYDPFSQAKQEDIDLIKDLQIDIHQHFIKIVKTRRGEKIAEADAEEIINGKFFSGSKAQKLGLIDGCGSLDEILRRDFGDNYQLKKFGKNLGFFQKRFISKQALLMRSISHFIDAEISHRSLWQKYKLKIL